MPSILTRRLLRSPMYPRGYTFRSRSMWIAPDTGRDRVKSALHGTSMSHVSARSQIEHHSPAPASEE